MIDIVHRIDIGDYTLDCSGVCGAPSLTLSAGREASLCISDVNETIKGVPEYSELKIGIHFHAFYTEPCKDIITILLESVPHCEVLITTDTETKRLYLESLLDQLVAKREKNHNWTYVIRVTPNLGRNILPLLKEGWPHLRDCDIVLHLHTKRSPHSSTGEQWADQLIATLAGSSRQVRAIKAAFATDSQLGMLIPSNWEGIRHLLHWGANFEIACMISNALWPQFKLSLQAPIVFPAGMMLWFRPAALKPLIAAKDLLQRPANEPILNDGTSLHALERLTLHACEVGGYNWRYVSLFTENSVEARNIGETLSVWTPQPDAYLMGVSALAQRYREQQVKVDRVEHLVAQCVTLSQQLENLSEELLERDLTIQELSARLHSTSKALADSEYKNQNNQQNSYRRINGAYRALLRLLSHTKP